MGALNSVHTKLKDFAEASEEMDTEFSTPEKASRHRPLNLDPRSPTQNIDRTPIIVEGTPSVQLQQSQAEKAKISSQKKGPVDPRSPSVEFTRTPLAFGHGSSANCDTPLKAPSGIPCSTLLTKQIDIQLRNSEPTLGIPASDEETCTSTPSPEKSLLTGESFDDSFDTAPLLESTRKLDLSDCPAKESISSVQESGTDDKLPPRNKLRCRQVNKILSNQTSSPSKVRSPLSLVENSPRVSQLPKKSNLSGGKIDRHTNSAVIDKENVCH